MSERQIDHDEYVVLTCTAHGKSVWQATDDPDLVSIDRGVFNPPPVRVLGPYSVGPNGAESVEDAVLNDPEAPSLDDPATWFSAVDWIAAYLAGVKDPTEGQCLECRRRLAPFEGRGGEGDDLLYCNDCCEAEEERYRDDCEHPGVSY